MAAPSNTVWGNTVVGDKSTRQGKIGISVTKTSETSTKVTVKIQTWFWSMYSISDTNNSYYYNAAYDPTTLIGSKSISHTVATGSGWSTSNQTLLGSSTYTYSKTTSKVTKYFSAKFTGIDSVGSSNVMSVRTSFTVPALASYTVKYNANGGTGAPSSQTKWYGKTLTLSSTKPTRTGYTFMGWATSASTLLVSYSAGGSYTSNAAITLYAVWEANTYTVKYNANGGTGAPSSQTKTYGKTLTLSTTIPTREYYTFVGWATSASATSATYSAGGSYTNNAAVTLYAVWVLAYVKPRITNVNIYRCDNNSVLTLDGTYAFVRFNWTCDLSVKSITVEYTNSSSDDYTTVEISPSGTMSGLVEVLIGNGELDPDTSYKIRITVDDSLSTVVYGHIVGSIFVMDAYVGGTGIAFGKKAEIPKMVDCAWTVYPRQGFEYPFLELGTDLDTVTTPNTYYGNAATTYEYVNCPITTATSFTLEVFPAGNAGQLMQRLTSCSSGVAIYHRHYYSNTWHDWVKTY